ncbi:glucose-6-phosphate exchanger SLC37A4 [Trichonephila clavipes]|nr:glucose-6-phosphate exchanger SLC37A4 [Trichonephila clavipes]
MRRFVREIRRKKAPTSKFGTLWSLLSSGNNFSGCISPILSVYLVTTYSWRTSVFTAGATSVVLGFVSLFALRGISKSEPRRDKSTTVKSGGASPSTFADLLKDPFLWLLSAGLLVVFCARTTMVDWGQLYLMEERKRTQHDGSVFTSSLESGGFLGRITAGYLTDHLIQRQATKSDPVRMPLRRNRRQYEQLTDFDRGRIIGLRDAGWSNRRIGRHLGRSDMVVARCWQQWITEGRVYRRGGSGRPRNTNDREDRAIRRVAISAPTTSLASIQRHLPPSRHPVPSRETIRRRLTEVGLRSRRPLRRLPLTPHHRQCRLDFCRPRTTWSVTDWRRVLQ